MEWGIRVYPPLSDNFLNFEHESKFGKFHFYKILRENVNNLIFGWAIEHFKNTIMDEIFDEVHM